MVIPCFAVIVGGNLLLPNTNRTDKGSDFEIEGLDHCSR